MNPEVGAKYTELVNDSSGWIDFRYLVSDDEITVDGYYSLDQLKTIVAMAEEILKEEK